MMEQIDPMAVYVHEPEGTLWVTEPTHTAGVSPEEWEAAAETLRALGQFAESGALAGDGQPLDVALTDARERARMQARRAREEGWREPEDGEEIAPGQHERVTLLIDRCDYFANAARVVRTIARPEKDAKYASFYREKLAPFLDAENEAAQVELRRYKREIGLLED